MCLFHTAGVMLNGSHEVGMQQQSVKVELDANNAQHFKPGLPYRGQVPVERMSFSLSQQQQ